MDYLSLDLSKTSPGITLYKDNKYYIYFLNHRKTKSNFYYRKDNIIIEGIDFFNYKDLDRFEVYKFILKNIKEIIKNCNELKVLIEDYSYTLADSRSVTGLAELKGIVNISDNLYFNREVIVFLICCEIGYDDN